jgi:hypothetical protein
MSRIDYSKWDNLDCSSSSEDENGDAGNGPARVTKLDGPSQVTFGGGLDRSTMQIEPSSFSAPVAAASPASPPVTTTGASSAVADSRKTKTLDLAEQRDQEQKQWTDKGGMVQVPCSSWSGSASPVRPTCQLYWSQTRYAVTLRLEFVQGGEMSASTSPTIHSKDIRVTVEGILPFQERQMAVGTFKPKLHVYGNTATNEKIVLLQDELPHPVHLPQDEEEEIGDLKHGQAGGRPIDWVIERQVMTDAPYISITLFKAVPMMGMSIWWKRPLISVPDLDHDVISPGDRANSSNTGNTNNGQAFAQAWEEAHRMFREKRRQESEDDS